MGCVSSQLIHTHLTGFAMLCNDCYDFVMCCDFFETKRFAFVFCRR